MRLRRLVVPALTFDGAIQRPAMRVLLLALLLTLGARSLTASHSGLFGDGDEVISFPTPTEATGFSTGFSAGNDAASDGGTAGSRSGAADTLIATKVEIRQAAFSPEEVRIRVGEAVEWINGDPLAHTVTASDGEWGSGLLEEGERFVRRFERPGRYSYYCIPHPMMTGIVIVAENRE